MSFLRTDCCSQAVAHIKCALDFPHISHNLSIYQERHKESDMFVFDFNQSLPNDFQTSSILHVFGLVLRFVESIFHMEF